MQKGDRRRFNRTSMLKRPRMKTRQMKTRHKIMNLKDGYIQQKREGKLKIKGTKEDILTKALEIEEYNDHVRGIGGHITPTIYFNSGRTWKHVDVITEHKRELMEARKKILEQDARIQNLEVMVYKKGASDISIDDKDSCSVKLHP
ncbi:uncharacterized protein LOC121989533 [Zingiber officinale]|uniref:uncharacterized protein LOC121989533 n=1 Tax=Zingiber officinale TaxID=94328 RepID=UPI001C4AB8F7|nr:uncharacterized protein LOC121989533 [Zingiber officinale]